MSNTFKGVIHTIKETEQVSEKFQKREFIVEEVYEGKFGEVRNPGKFLLVQEKVGLIDQFKLGDKVLVSYDIDGRFWTPDEEGAETICFNDHRVWKIEPVAVATQPVTANIEPGPTGQAPVSETPITGTAKTPEPGPGTSKTPEPFAGGEDDNGPDDLPF